MTNHAPRLLFCGLKHGIYAHTHALSAARYRGHYTTRTILLPFSRIYHTSQPRLTVPAQYQSSRKIGTTTDKSDMDPAERANNPPIGNRPLKDFHLDGRVFVVTGGARGLGLKMAEALCEAGGKVHCLDRLPEPDPEFREAQKNARLDYGGSLHYGQVDVRDTASLDTVMGSIADTHSRLDGLIAAAGVQQIKASIQYSAEEAQEMLAINYTGVYMTATSAARQMLRYRIRGSVVLIASMSGLIANKGLVSPVYNCSKAAVIQLARSLAMEWGHVQPDGSGGIRVNALSPGHIVTPMVEENFRQVPGLRETWEKENMLGRLAQPEEFKAAALFLISDASSFMTGGNLVMDGGHTAW